MSPISASGLNSQLGFVAESTYGTYVAPTKFVEFSSESLALNIERMESSGIRAGRRVHLSSQWAAGRRWVEGSVEMELSNVGQGLLWQHAMGASATTGPARTNIYTHTYTPADMQTLFMTMQINRPFITGANQAFSYTGVKVGGWEISCSAGEIATVTFDILAQDETTAQALATATYPANYAPMTFTGGVLQIAGSAVDIMSVTVTADNALRDDRYFLRGTGLRKLPIENGKRSYTFSADCDWDSVTQYNRFTGATEAAFNLTFTGGTISGSSPSGPYTFSIQGNVRLDGSTPQVGGFEALGQTITGKFVASGATDDTAIKIVRTTSEVTATA